MTSEAIARQRELRLERLRQAIGGRTSVTPREVFVGLGYPAHLFDRRADEQIRAALAEVGFVRPAPDAWVRPASTEDTRSHVGEH